MGARPAPLLTRPVTRGDCAGVPRPCPWTSCRYHTRSTRDLVHRNEKPDTPLDGVDSCALDVADRGPQTLDFVGHTLRRITRERVRQLEAKALQKFRRAALRLGCLAEMDEYLDHVLANHWHSGLGDVID